MLGLFMQTGASISGLCNTLSVGVAVGTRQAARGQRPALARQP